LTEAAVAFEVLARCGAARRGRLATPHGVIETPAFMPVGTLGAVKGLAPQALEDLGAEVMLANLYHLSLRPGVEVIAELGGIHRFTAWERPILTDSGGYQVFSLAHRNRIDDGGVTFKSHLDGARVRFTPERVVAMQARLGVDVAMVLDECPPWPVDETTATEAWRRTLGWAESALAEAARVRPAGGPRGAAGEGGDGGDGGEALPWRGALFGIAQGSTFEDLRLQAAAELSALPFDGFAIGGVSVGEPGELRRAVVEWTAPALPADRPRYLMGVGKPDDLVGAVARGIDMFDCVLPTRSGRTGQAFTRRGALNLRNARHQGDPRPLDPDCACPSCADFSRAYLHHLFRCEEMLGPVLLSAHNLHYYQELMAGLRAAIADGRLGDMAERFARDQAAGDLPPLD